MPEERRSEAELPKVKVRNATRHSLSFRVPGRSVVLQPGQEEEVHKAYLESEELKALLRRGEIVSAAAAPAPAGEVDTGGTVSRGRGRAARPG